MQTHKTTTLDTVKTFGHGETMAFVKAARKIKADRNPWRGNQSKKTPPVLPRA